MKSEFYFHPVIGYLRIILKQFSSTLESTSTSGLHKTHIHTQGEIRVWNMWKNCKNTVIWPFPDQLIFRIYHFEVNMMTYLDFHDPAVKSFLNNPKKLYWNIVLDDSVGAGGWVFPGQPLFSFKGILSKFSKVNYNVQGTYALCNPNYRIRGGERQKQSELQWKPKSKASLEVG